ncbi:MULTISPECIES: lysozyme [Providencia]|uniref:lysozyme n=1 Tax=Providencia TaxID=586 RepID=UPI0018E8B206|nr:MULTISPECIES: lysozyme [Providencia]EJD6081438.1 lysozyme [Providencia rettgeri]EJD6600652.1 lysozyme [Providencia rettgeri]EJD6612163.1 lysozyme [Providencia rettgeri]ELL9148282.1 lysozyme [Providencia rettgeri]MBQ0329760.1 lysozyme [Providencia rettgeri]
MPKIPNKVQMAAAGGTIALTAAMLSFFEGVKYKPYEDVVGVLTVCFGHTGTDIIPTKTYSESECLTLLEKGLNKVRKGVDPLIKVDIDDNTRAAIYSFAYNVGTGAFARSTMLKKLNAGDIAGACNELKRWTYAGGKEWKGLITRREIEKAVCLGEFAYAYPLSLSESPSTWQLAYMYSETIPAVLTR